MGQYYSTDIEVAMQEQLTVTIQKQTELYVAEELAQKQMYEAQADAKKTMAINEATVKQFKYRNEKTSSGFSQSLDYLATINLPNEVQAVEDFMNFLRVRAVQEHSSSDMTINVPGSMFSPPAT